MPYNWKVTYYVNFTVDQYILIHYVWASSCISLFLLMTVRVHQKPEEWRATLQQYSAKLKVQHWAVASRLCKKWVSSTSNTSSLDLCPLIHFRYRLSVSSQWGKLWENAEKLYLSRGYTTINATKGESNVFFLFCPSHFLITCELTAKEQVWWFNQVL